MQAPNKILSVGSKPLENGTWEVKSPVSSSTHAMLLASVTVVTLGHTVN